MARVARMARTVARMARWLADLADPSSIGVLKSSWLPDLEPYEETFDKFQTIRLESLLNIKLRIVNK